MEEIDQRAYYNQPVWKRIVVILAGPAVNLLIAFAIVWVLFLSNGEVVASKQVAAVDKGTPAADGAPRRRQARLGRRRHGQRERAARSARDPRCAGAQVNGCVAATPAKIVVARDGKLVTFELRPRYSAADHRPLVGFEFGSTRAVGRARPCRRR